MTYSIIQKSQLEGALRLDAEYYQPEYLKLLKVIQKWPLKKLKEISYITDGSHEVREYIKKGVLFLRSQDITELGLDVQDPVYISKEEDFSLRRSKPKLNDILVVKTGNVGVSLVVDKGFPDCNLPADIALIKLKTNFFNAYFIVTYLNSQIGRRLVLREMTGLSRPRVVLETLQNLWIPQIPLEKQREIERLVVAVYREKKESDYFYSQAENLLLEELGLKDFKVEDDLFYVVNLSEVKSAHRADAEYFQPKYEKLIEKIKKYGAKSLLNIAQNVPAKFDPKSQPTKIFRYVELADITSSIGTIESSSEISGEEAPSRAKRVLKANDVIISSVEGSLEKVALVGKEQEGYLASNGFFQLRSKEILPEVLLVLAKSLVFQMQLEKQCAGTILTAVPKDALKYIIVPILPKPTQQKIADLVQKSHEARKKAKELLEKAKQKVEELIESQI